MILTSPQCINSILHKSEEMSLSLEVTHSASNLKWQTRKKCLAVLTFVHLYSRDEKGLRSREMKFCCPDLAQLGMEAEDHPWNLCQWHQMCKEEVVGSGQQHEAVWSQKQWVMGRKKMDEEEDGGGEVWRGKRTSCGTRTPGISEPVLRSNFGPMLWGSIN